MGAPNIPFPNKTSIFALRPDILSIIINILDFKNAGDCFLGFDSDGDCFLDLKTLVTALVLAEWTGGDSVSMILAKNYSFAN